MHQVPCQLGIGDMAMNETNKGTVSDMGPSQGWKSGVDMGERACLGSLSSSIFLFAAIDGTRLRAMSQP